MTTLLAHRMQVDVLAPVSGDDLAAEAREVKLSSSPERPPLVKVVYARSRTAAWVTVERIVSAIDQARLVDVANGARQCSQCGCTDGFACPEGCAWATIEPPVCTACVDELAEAAG